MREEAEKVDSPYREELQGDLADGLPARPELGVDLLEQKLNNLNVEDREKFLLLDGKSRLDRPRRTWLWGLSDLRAYHLRIPCVFDRRRAR
jgi:hypothetical protein